MGKSDRVVVGEAAGTNWSAGKIQGIFALLLVVSVRLGVACSSGSPARSMRWCSARVKKMNQRGKTAARG
jgi:hypothetical protein